MRAIFSDDKLFFFHGKVLCAYCYTNRRIGPIHFSARQKGGGDVMVWGASSTAGTANLPTIEESWTR